MPGGQTIAQLIPNLHLAKVSGQLNNIRNLRIPSHLGLKELSELPSMEEFEKSSGFSCPHTSRLNSRQDMHKDLDINFTQT
ncbi:MAG: hypothetical protein A3G20_07885 [Acidobacteria bacterium RIFCSPLOWO2_12_FULL_59_11]|nr:MAG: hypothetical protein A3G20_07885 [Acidobacteria bacterium RIFCSPLOWO2_12_FULL_59_11]